jgi:hypothetical protein
MRPQPGPHEYADEHHDDDDALGFPSSGSRSSDPSSDMIPNATAEIFSADWIAELQKADHEAT